MGSEAERLNIENIKQKYWARGDESELGVVQNRMYTKSKKFELGLYAGVVATDPFLSVYSLGASLNYNFNEYISLGVFGYKDYVSPSSALVFLRNPYPNGAGSDTSTNEPRWFMGTLKPSPACLYGKLSLIGKAIIHYDFHFIGGVGVTSTESGKYFTPEIGVGQQFYLTRYMTLRADYRLMIHNETILQARSACLKPDIGISDRQPHQLQQLRQRRPELPARSVRKKTPGRRHHRARRGRAQETMSHFMINTRQNSTVLHYLSATVASASSPRALTPIHAPRCDRRRAKSPAPHGSDDLHRAPSPGSPSARRRFRDPSATNSCTRSKATSPWSRASPKRWRFVVSSGRTPKPSGWASIGFRARAARLKARTHRFRTVS